MTIKNEMKRFSPEAVKRDSGFSLIEVIIALVILMIVVMGVFAAFTYATVYNTGNSRRSQALSVLQQEVELLRSLKFNPVVAPAVIDARLAGGVKTAQTVTAADNSVYLVNVTVDDDPFTANNPLPQVDVTKTIKEITVTVTPAGSNGTWITANATRAVFRRVRSN
ncbi:MAG: prepilin-type N-terminal cleavage/methylation domain-containing protein [Pyrinomonadaceae bacterium]